LGEAYYTKVRGANDAVNCDEVTCTNPLPAFCLKIRLELPHLSMIAMFYAAETRV
jgi:hypothetical protein